MSKAIAFVVVILSAAWIWHFQTQAQRATQAAVTAPALPAAALAAPAPATMATTAPVAPSAATPAATPATTPAPASASVATTTPDTRPEWVRNPPELGLTRLLAGDQTVSYDGRARTVLGTKESSGQPVLLVRDEASGQIDYFQSGLTFRLKPGYDFETFVRERKAMQRHFSNTDYATVLVDAGSIASEYNALQNDPRVTLVTFLKLKTLTNPR